MNLHRINRLVAASPPLLLALFIAKLWFTGTLGYFVNDRTVWIVLLGGVTFAAVGCVALWQADQRLSWQTLVFVTPVVIGLVVPAQPLSAATGQSSSLGALQLASHVSSGPPGDEFGAWIGDLAIHSDANWWSGQHVTLVGFATGQVGLPPRSLIVGRYLVTCCVVDATLMGFPVQIARGPLPAQGQWIQVSGVFGQGYWTDPTGQRYPLIIHAHVSRVSIPSSPYLSP
jgi:uncharacterized repeat protein (TIGR03943 family)